MKRIIQVQSQFEVEGDTFEDCCDEAVDRAMKMESTEWGTIELAPTWGKPRDPRVPNYRDHIKRRAEGTWPEGVPKFPLYTFRPSGAIIRQAFALREIAGLTLEEVYAAMAEGLAQAYDAIFDRELAQLNLAPPPPMIVPRDMVASLQGSTLTPAPGGYFSGVMAVPIGFRREGESDNDVALRWLEHLDKEDTENGPRK